MRELFLYMVLATGINCFLVAVVLTLTRSHKPVDIMFTVREWFLGILFVSTFILTREYVQSRLHVLENITMYRLIIIAMLVVTSMASFGALLYNYIWRMRHEKNNQKED